MTERIALDSNVVIGMFRSPGGEFPPQLVGRKLLLPLTVVGELFAGAYASAQRDRNLAATEAFIAQHTILSPDAETARIYGRLRAEYRAAQGLTVAKLNDLWIAAVCIQHDVPLLTSDRGFLTMPTLTVVPL